MCLDEVVQRPADTVQKVVLLTGLYVAIPEFDTTPGEDCRSCCHREAELNVVASCKEIISSECYLNFVDI